MKNFRTYQLSLELYEACQGVRLKSYMQDQLQRAALSVALNISEGAAKPTLKDQRRFFAIAYGSVREVQTILTLAKRSHEFKLADVVGAHLYRLLNPGPKPDTR